MLVFCLGNNILKKNKKEPQLFSGKVLFFFVVVVNLNHCLVLASFTYLTISSLIKDVIQHLYRCTID